MRKGAAALAGILVVGMAAGTLLLLRRSAPSTPSAPSASVLLVTFDTLRADRAGAYGGPPGLTPHLDRLAAQGAVFAEAVSSAPLTLPSHATILSGLEPPRHGVRDNGTYVFPEDRPTLATLLRDKGYATGAFVAAYVLDRRFGLARGFSTYDDVVERRESGPSVLESERPCDAVAAAAQAWIAQQSGPFFAWVHFYDPHAPYAPPAAERDRWPGRPYEAEVAHADACFGGLWDAARARAGERLVVAALSDHGEGLGDHGEKTHGFFVYQTTLRIPLLIAGPGITPGPRRDGIARTADVAPTLLTLLGLDVPAGLDGRDALAPGPSRESYAETHYPRSLGWAPLHSYRVGDLKYIDAPRPELYDLSHDPGEQRDLAASRPADVSRLRETLARVRRDERGLPRTAADPEVAERLQALGYVAGAPATEESRGALADPKDRVALWHSFEEAIWAEGRGETESAIASFRSLLKDEPGNATFRRSLAAALRKSSRTAEANALLAGLEGAAPDDPLLWHEQAVVLAEVGKLDLAVRAEERAIALNPVLPELHNHLGVLQARRGAAPLALRAFTRATELDPNNGRAWNNRANALRDLGRGPEAAEAYRTAMRLVPNDPDPRNGLGVLAVEAGDLQGAGTLFREILARHPEHHESRMNLAVVLVRQGRVDDARRELRAILAGGPDRGTADRARAFLNDLLGGPTVAPPAR
jgi:choline-sulfatase